VTPEKAKPTPDASVRELMVVREIAHAFLTADRPEEVFQFALERVSPLVGATFASIYLIEPGDEQMRLAAAYNWPEKFRPFLGEMRVKVGLGPSGEAVSERHAITIPDVFADASLTDWQEVAKELGFRALVALPLSSRGTVLGAVTFYFAETGGLTPERSGLLQIVADQMAATTEKAALIQQLRRTNAALTDSNAELEKQYLAALEARRMKDEFLANISHELRTPLTAVLGYADLMQEGLSGPLTGEQSSTIEQMTSASQRLLELIDDLLELTTLKGGEARLTVESFDAREAMKDALAAAREPAAGVVVKLKMSEGDAIWIRSDRRKVAKILTSLLNNAFKFTTEGDVLAALESRNNSVRFSVRDTGIGIDPAAHEVVFEEFRQADGSATRRFGGSGLGLALSRQLARLLGGDITLESAPSSGSQFTLSLPVEYTPAPSNANRQPVELR
jgi:signal transduction histidine kinase